MKVEPLLIENICLNDPNETKNNNKRKHFNDFTYRNIDSRLTLTKNGKSPQKEWLGIISGKLLTPLWILLNNNPAMK